MITAQGKLRPLASFMPEELETIAPGFEWPADDDADNVTLNDGPLNLLEAAAAMAMAETHRPGLGQLACYDFGGDVGYAWFYLRRGVAATLYTLIERPRTVKWLIDNLAVDGRSQVAQLRWHGVYILKQPPADPAPHGEHTPFARYTLLRDCAVGIDALTMIATKKATPLRALMMTPDMLGDTRKIMLDEAHERRCAAAKKQVAVVAKYTVLQEPIPPEQFELF
jgi:hypothetical protein